LVLDADLKIISANRNFYRTFKVTPGETIGSFIYDLGNKQWDIPKLRELLEEVLPEKEAFDDFEVEHNFQDIGHKIMLLNARQIYRKDIGAKMILLAIEDITERRLIEEKLLLAAIVESSKDAIIGKSLDGIITSWNKGAEEIYGYTKSEIIGKSISVLIPPELPDELTDILRKIKLGEAIENYETVRQRKDGQNIYVSLTVSAIHDAEGRILGASTTERKRAEEELKQSEERYRSIFENAQEGIFRSTPDGKIIMANQAMAKMFGYESPEEMMTGITDIARQHYVNPEDRRKLKEMIEEHGFIKGYEAQNYRKDGSIIWISLTMHAVRDEKGQIIYYDGIMRILRTAKRAVERIRKALGATVQAIAVTVETRDPYTAGHQRRVADLARAIATEMNLPADQIDGIRMAAAIHDLGKISVPAEILSKPTKLTNIEFSLIKTHSQSGYDILKDIDFPWPVARIVLEHHERMNGSGYPNGLTGDNILMESRILAVADVVESMASHRPYRPSLGIEAALEEIEKNRGTLYDNAVADACLRLFREKGYQLSPSASGRRRRCAIVKAACTRWCRLSLT
jgi:PAS domain S-box-containing protein